MHDDIHMQKVFLYEIAWFKLTQENKLFES